MQRDIRHEAGDVLTSVVSRRSAVILGHEDYWNAGERLCLKVMDELSGFACVTNYVWLHDNHCKCNALFFDHCALKLHELLSVSMIQSLSGDTTELCRNKLGRIYLAITSGSYGELAQRASNVPQVCLLGAGASPLSK